MMLNGVEVTKRYARDLIQQQKAEILEKLNRGETEETILTGGNAYTQSEWNKMMDEMDETIDEIKEEQKIYFEKKFKDEQEQEAYFKEIYEKFLAEKSYKARETTILSHIDGEGAAPYVSKVDENGMLTHNAISLKDTYKVTDENGVEYLLAENVNATWLGCSLAGKSGSLLWEMDVTKEQGEKAAQYLKVCDKEEQAEMMKRSFWEAFFA